MINRDRLTARREELQRQLEQCRANYIALQGAISDLDYLLAEGDEPVKAEEEKE